MGTIGAALGSSSAPFAKAFAPTAQSLGLVGGDTSRAKLSSKDDGDAGGRINSGRDGRTKSVLVGVHFRTA